MPGNCRMLASVTASHPPHTQPRTLNPSLVPTAAGNVGVGMFSSTGAVSGMAAVAGGVSSVAGGLGMTTAAGASPVAWPLVQAASDKIGHKIRISAVIRPGTVSGYLNIIPPNELFDCPVWPGVEPLGSTREAAGAGCSPGCPRRR